MRILALSDLLDTFPSLADAPRELEPLSAWFDAAGPTDQTTHAAALVLQLLGVPDIEFSEVEAMHVWDGAHRAAYQRLRERLAHETSRRAPVAPPLQGNPSATGVFPLC